MTRSNGDPRNLAGCEVLPALASVRTMQMPDRRADRPTLARRSATGRFDVLNVFVDQTAGKLGRAELLVWLVLYRDCRDGIARTGQADIARRTGLARRTVGLSVGRLESRGLVETVRRGGLNRGPSSYRVHPLDRNG